MMFGGSRWFRDEDGPAGTVQASAHQHQAAHAVAIAPPQLGQPTQPPAAAPPRQQGPSPWSITGAIGTIAALVVAGLAVYSRVEAERDYNEAMAEFQQEMDDADAAAQAQQDEWDRQQAELEDIADATDDIDVEVGSAQYDGYGTSTAEVTIKNISGRTESFMVELTVVDPDSPSEIYDSATVSTPTLAPGGTAHQTAIWFSSSKDWPKDSEGRWSYSIASATGYAG